MGAKQMFEKNLVNLFDCDIKTNMQDDIQLLIKNIAKGDTASFKRFYTLFSGLVFSIALRMLAVRVEAEDLLQEVFLYAWQKAASYDPSRGAPEAWLSTITRTRAIDKLRSRRRREVPESQRGDVNPEMPRLEAVAPAAEADLVQSLAAREALQKLTNLQREVLELAYFGGYTQEEIAEKLKAPLGTVKTRIRDGLISLRQIYKDSRQSVGGHS